MQKSIFILYQCLSQRSQTQQPITISQRGNSSMKSNDTRAEEDESLPACWSFIVLDEIRKVKSRSCSGFWWLSSCFIGRVEDHNKALQEYHRESSPKNRHPLLIHLPSGHSSCRWYFFSVERLRRIWEETQVCMQVNTLAVWVKKNTLLHRSYNRLYFCLSWMLQRI